MTRIVEEIIVTPPVATTTSCCSRRGRSRITTSSSKVLNLMVQLLLLVSSIMTVKITMVHATFQWDQDTLDDCEARALSGQCILDDTTFYQCPVSCRQTIDFAGDRTQGEIEDGSEDDLFELATPLPPGGGEGGNNNKLLSWDRFEGYVTLVAVIPLLPGMAQYYYDMMEHLHSVFPYTLEIVVFPLKITQEEEAEEEDSTDGHPPPPPPVVKLKIPENSKIVVAKELEATGHTMGTGTIESNPILEYIEEAINPGSPFLFTDRVITYVISFNAKFIEKDASPSLDFLERLVSHHLTAYEWKGEL